MNYLGQLAALGAALAWTFAGLINERFTKGASPSGINFFRLTLGFILLTLLSLFMTGGLLNIPGGSDDAHWLLLSGIVGFAIGDSFLMKAFQELGARITLLIFSLAPVLAAIGSLLFFAESLTYLNVLGMALTLSGLVIVITSKDDSGKQRYSAVGVRAALIAATGQASGVLLSKLGLETYSAITATQMRLIGAFFGMLLFFTLARKWPQVLSLRQHKRAWIAVGLNAFIGTLVGVSLSMVAIKMTKAAIATTLMSIMPILIIPFSYLLKEQIRRNEIAGAILSVAGIAILFL